jgi:predicted nucleic-acid-binding Zn-ribbon protein
MRDGTCPKCRSREIYQSPADLGMGRMPIANMRAVTMATYVCTDCGYMEYYVDDPNDLRKIVEKWHKVH